MNESLNLRMVVYLAIYARFWQNVNGQEMTSPFQPPGVPQISFHDVRFVWSRPHRIQDSKERTWKLSME